MRPRDSVREKNSSLSSNGDSVSAAFQEYSEGLLTSPSTGASDDGIMRGVSMSDRACSIRAVCEAYALKIVMRYNVIRESRFYRRFMEVGYALPSIFV